tara:strand:- start:585 stop:1454 length:870 start_codon:yes stop_codon:yes gene_type:complete
MKDMFINYNWMPLAADHVIDLSDDFYHSNGVTRLHSQNTFDPLHVKNNDIIFVKTDFIVNGFFVDKILDKIYNRFNLITGVSSYHLGRDGGDSYLKILNHPALNKWFCTNPPNIENSKIIPLPIGFEEKERAGGNQETIRNAHKNKTPFSEKINKILLPHHTLGTNPERAKLYSFLKDLPFVDTQEEKLPFDQYLELANKYKFVICLEGSGPDVHRNYETLLVGSVPINKKNVIEKVFDYHKCCGIFVDEWKSLNQDKFDEISGSSYDFENVNKFLKVEYHMEHIRNSV